MQTAVKIFVLLVLFVCQETRSQAVLQLEQFRHYIDTFNADDVELYKQFYPNEAAWDFLSKNMLLLDYPDKEIERTYYFRWWTYRKHIKQTPYGFVVSEFLPNVGWAKKHNSISCAAGHHFREGRWLRDSSFLNDYTVFKLRKGGIERGKDYNHSTFCDLIINGLIGFRPSLDNGFTVYPLVPADTDYFALDGIRYHGKTSTILYGKTGERYRRGKGFRVYADDVEKYHSERCRSDNRYDVQRTQTERIVVRCVMCK